MEYELYEVGGNTKSCGCFRKETAPLNRKQVVDSSIKSLYRIYKYSAKRRNYTFTISLDFFKSIVFQNCYYCGEEPYNTFATHKGNCIPIVYSGVDRVINEIGYEENNCVPCCQQCNVAKASYTKNEFLTWIKKITKNLNLK